LEGGDHRCHGRVGVEWDQASGGVFLYPNPKQFVGEALSDLFDTGEVELNDLEALQARPPISLGSARETKSASRNSSTCMTVRLKRLVTGSDSSS
jgi:hypothetical protein